MGLPLGSKDQMAKWDDYGVLVYGWRIDYELLMDYIKENNINLGPYRSLKINEWKNIPDEMKDLYIIQKFRYSNVAEAADYYLSFFSEDTFMTDDPEYLNVKIFDINTELMKRAFKLQLKLTKGWLEGIEPDLNKEMGEDDQPYVFVVNISHYF